MQLVRALITEARLSLADWHAVEAGTARPDREGVFLSLVPTQLHRLLEDRAATDWLRRCRAVFLGGAAAWPALLERAHAVRIPLAPAYGMTETAAQVCCLKPDEFLSGRSGVGRALPHARLSVVDDEERPVAAGKTGRIRVESEALFLGYQGELGRRGDGYVTTDLGSMDADGYLTVAGRSGDTINTGGEKVMPTEVEAAIREVGLVEDVVVCGRSDPEWGEVVCALVVSSRFPGEIEARSRLKPLLASHKIPRRWILIEKVPRNALGKLDRKRAADLIDLNDDQERNRRDS
jgi:O-succinylbenzoic acid--CoA ligase